MINLAKTLRSFKFALEGVKGLFFYENNARVHLLIAIVVVVLGWCWELTHTEWMFIALAIGSVWAAEAFNTAVEKLCDLVVPTQDMRIKYIKDLAAAGVFMMALVAVCIGLFIFGTRFVSIFL